MRRLAHLARGRQPVDVHLTAVGDGHGHLWAADAHTYGFVLDRNGTATASRSRTIAQLFQIADSGIRLRLCATGDLHERLADDLTWAEQAGGTDHTAMTVRTVQRWLDDGQLTTAVTDQPPVHVAALAGRAAGIFDRWAPRRFSDSTDPYVDQVTGGQLRDRAAADGRTIVYTDGSEVNGQPPGRRCGSWAWVVDADTHGAGTVDDAPGGTVWLEAEAIRQAILHAPGDRLLVVTDATWVLEMLDGRRGDHDGIVDDLRETLAGRPDVQLEAIPGHSDPLGHNLADRLTRSVRGGMALFTAPQP